MASLCRAQIWQSSAVEKAGKRTQAMKPSAVASRERIHIIRQSSSGRAINMERLPATCAERFAAIAYMEKLLGCPVQMPLSMVKLHVEPCTQTFDV